MASRKAKSSIRQGARQQRATPLRIAGGSSGNLSFLSSYIILLTVLPPIPFHPSSQPIFPLLFSDLSSLLGKKHPAGIPKEAKERDFWLSIHFQGCGEVDFFWSLYHHRHRPTIFLSCYLFLIFSILFHSFANGHVAALVQHHTMSYEVTVTSCLLLASSPCLKALWQFHVAEGGLTLLYMRSTVTALCIADSDSWLSIRQRTRKTRG